MLRFRRKDSWSVWHLVAVFVVCFIALNNLSVLQSQTQRNIKIQDREFSVEVSGEKSRFANANNNEERGDLDTQSLALPSRESSPLLRNEKNCEPKTKIAFMKTHKTGSRFVVRLQSLRKRTDFHIAVTFFSAPFKTSSSVTAARTA